MTTIKELRSRADEIEAQIEKIMNEQVLTLLNEFSEQFEVDDIQLSINQVSGEDKEKYEVELLVVI